MKKMENFDHVKVKNIGMTRNHRKRLKDKVMDQDSSQQTRLKSGPPLAFVNKVLLEYIHSHSFTFCLAAFALQQQSCTVATETVQPAKQNIFTVWSFTEKSLPTSKQGGFYNICKQQQIKTCLCHMIDVSCEQYLRWLVTPNLPSLAHMLAG